MAIKVIIMDVDGTLTNSKKQITPKTKEMLIEAQNKGIKLVLASGRPVRIGERAGNGKTSWTIGIF